MSTPSEVTAAPPLTFDLSSLGGLSLENLTEAVESVGGKIEVEVVNLTDKEFVSVSKEDLGELFPPQKKTRGSRKPKGVSSASTPPELLEEDPNLSDPPPTFGQPSTLKDSPRLSFSDRIALFGFHIPPVTLNSWMPQTIANLTTTLKQWESDFQNCQEWKPVPPPMRCDIPPLLAPYDKPTDDQIEKAWNEGSSSALVGQGENRIRTTDETINPYPIRSILAQSWLEGFAELRYKEPSEAQKLTEAYLDKTANEIVDKIIEPALKQQLEPEPRLSKSDQIEQTNRRAREIVSQSAAYEAGRISARQEAVDGLLVQLFSENRVVASIDEEIREAKAALKELNETREEHLSQSKRLIGELEKASKGEFQPSLL